MRTQLDPQLAPGHRQVGVMPRLLAQVADGVDEHQGRRPAVGVVLAADPAVREVPGVEAQLLELALDRVDLVDLRLGLGALHGDPPSGYITTPPLTLMAWPVTNEAAGEAR